MPRARSLPLLAALLVAACGENTGSSADDPAGAGGTSGGRAASGGTTGGSRAAETGGSATRGGTTGGIVTGGAPAGSGGVAGSAGLSSGSGGSGGASASGSKASNAGSGGMGGRGGGAAAGASGSAGAFGSGGASSPRCGPVTEVPEAVRKRLDLDPFYKKHVDASGLSVLSSAAPADESLLLACELLNNLLGKRDDVRQELIRRKARFAIIGKNEGTAEIPEYGYVGGPQEDIDYINQRARGLGGIVASCGEENILCLSGDRYRNESICVHEYSHTISLYGAYTADDTFEDDLKAAFDSAMASGILENTYRTSNEQEYWAEGVQDWYDTNDTANPPNGIHNGVNTREELKDYDPTLYALIGGLFPEATDWGDCHVR
jgi:hypothetical protein